MVIFISGSINSGKTTTAKALAKKLSAQFIDIDDVNDRVPNFNLATDIPKGIALAIEDINKLTGVGESVVVSYPIRPEDYMQITEGLHDKNPQFITLAPRLEVAQSKRGDRKLTEWEVARIKHHYDTGIATPVFGKVLDNSDLSLGETVDQIEKFVTSQSDTIGLARGTVRLVQHDPTWPDRFEAEAKLLRKKLGIEDIQHVGSTSITGILAKPIIDIAIPVDSLSVVDDWVQPLAELGYSNDGPEVVPERRFFAKGSEEKRTVYLHIVTKMEHQRLLTFRNILRANTALAQEYSDLKAKLAASLANDRNKYTRQKNEFIQRVLETMK